MVVKILTCASEFLRIPSEEIRNTGNRIQRLFDDLIETMDEASGIGLSAIQIGIPLRAAVVSNKGDKDGLICMINPVIESFSGKSVVKEGCLSIPGIFVNVKRPETIVLRALDRKGQEIRLKLSGLTARAVQHEIDHMDGKLFTDLLPFYTKIKIYPQLRRIKRGQLK